MNAKQQNPQFKQNTQNRQRRNVGGAKANAPRRAASRPQPNRKPQSAPRFTNVDNAELRRRLEQAQRDRATHLANLRRGQQNVQPTTRRKRRNGLPKAKPMVGPIRFKQETNKTEKSRNNVPGFFTGAGGLIDMATGLPGIGKFLGSTVDRIIGSGDYTMVGPELKENSFLSGTTPPEFTSNNGSMTETIVAHREYLGDIFSASTLVNGATPFNASVFPINPGMVSTFPWLASIANQYEEYKLLGMIFEFKSMSGEAITSTNTSIGSVIMSTQYDCYSGPFTQKLTQENYEYACSAKPSVSMIHAVECAPELTLSDILQTRSGPVSGGDLRLSDIGNFQISTVGMQGANVNLGELWVSYHVQLMKPKMGTTLSAYDRIDFASSALTSFQPFAGPTYSASNNLGVVLSQQDYKTLYFPPSASGNSYLLTYTGNYASANGLTTPTFIYNGCSNISNPSWMPGIVSGTVNGTMWIIPVRVSASNASIVVSCSTTAYNFSTSVLTVTIIPSTSLKSNKTKKLEPAFKKVEENSDSSSSSDSEDDSYTQELEEQQDDLEYSSGSSGAFTERMHKVLKAIFDKSKKHKHKKTKFSVPVHSKSESEDHEDNKGDQEIIVHKPKEVNEHENLIKEEVEDDPRGRSRLESQDTVQTQIITENTLTDALEKQSAPSVTSKKSKSTKTVVKR